MATKIENCLKGPLGQDTSILELHVSVKSELMVAKHEGIGYEVDFEDSGHNETLKLPEKRSIEEISSVLEGSGVMNGIVDVLSIQKCQRRRLVKDGAITHFAGENGSVVLQVYGKKERLKHLIKATLLKSFGRVMGLCEGKQKTRLVKVSDGAVKFKRDGIPSKKILQEEEATALLAEVEVMKRLCNESEKIRLPGMVEEIHRDVVKYWLRRYSLFSRFDEGIKLDEEGLFSVTPEEIAKHQAAHCGCGTVVDAFTGVGGNAIQFASMNFHVIAIDIDPKKIEYARHNAEIYGVADRIDFIVGDFFQLAPSLKADVVFLSPPWGGPDYIRAEKYDIETMLKPKNGFSLFKVALSIAPSVALFLPRTVKLDQLAQLSWLSNPPLAYEIEKNYVHDELKAVTAYYGKIAL